MRHLLFLTVIAAFVGAAQNAYAISSIYCGSNISGFPICVSVSHQASVIDAASNGMAACHHLSLLNCSFAGNTISFSNQCRSVAAALNGSNWFSASAPVGPTAQDEAISDCEKNTQYVVCTAIHTVCDLADDSAPQQRPLSYTSQIDPQFDYLSDPDSFKILHWLMMLQSVWNGIGNGIGTGLGILLVGFVFWKREPIINLLIHGNLPYKLPVYGEDIQCLFKRTQRVNWYGRIIFGIATDLAMTHQQLIDIRKYWLGRVVAFDSLRRQRQNELARMHMQLAATAKSDAHDKKAFWSRRWGTVRTFLRRLFWIFAAAFRLLFSFFFIRVNLARLVRGTVIESRDLTLVLQAKEAIEQSAMYLKEYLETANTFDGRDEVV
jgi:hypothetical protein